MEVGDNARRKEHGLSPGELAVIQAPASQDFIFQHPGVGGLRIFLHIPWHDSVAPSANGEVERRSGLSRIREACSKSSTLYESFGLDCRLHQSLAFAVPT